MILHFSHIGLTDGRTFMIPFGFGPDEVALVTGTATATMPPERTFAHRTHHGPSATKQNTKRLRRVMSTFRGALWDRSSRRKRRLPTPSASPNRRATRARRRA